MVFVLYSLLGCVCILRGAGAEHSGRSILGGAFSGAKGFGRSIFLRGRFCAEHAFCKQRTAEFIWSIVSFSRRAFMPQKVVFQSTTDRSMYEERSIHSDRCCLPRYTAPTPTPVPYEVILPLHPSLPQPPAPAPFSPHNSLSLSSHRSVLANRCTLKRKKKAASVRIQSVARNAHYETPRYRGVCGIGGEREYGTSRQGRQTYEGVS